MKREKTTKSEGFTLLDGGKMKGLNENFFFFSKGIALVDVHLNWLK